MSLFRKTLIPGLLIGLLFSSACKHDPTDVVEPDPEPLPCDTTGITYASRVLPILQVHCYSCHSGTSPQGGIDLTDWSQMTYLVNTGAFWGAINHEAGYEPMPQGLPKLSACDLLVIQTWLNDTTLEDPTPVNPCDPDTVYFVNDILPLIQSSCALSGCHDPATAQDGVILNNYQNIIQTGDIQPGDPDNSELYENLIETDPDKIMPPPPRSPLTATQIALVRKWILQGALNNSCDGGPCDTLNVTFSQTIAPLIQNRCFGCHSGSTPQGNVSLDGHANIATYAASGQLLGAISHAPGYAPMPQNGMKLTDCQISQFRKWINDGAPNN